MNSFGLCVALEGVFGLEHGEVLGEHGKVPWLCDEFVKVGEDLDVTSLVKRKWVCFLGVEKTDLCYGD